MVERLGRRLIGSVLMWDVVLTLLLLYSTTWLRLWLDYGHDISPQRADIPWPMYLGVVCIWVSVFLLIRPQHALFFRTLLEAIGRLLAAVGLAVLVFAGVLYLSFRDISRLQFLYFAALDLIGLLLLHLAVRFGIRHRANRAPQRRALIVGSDAEAQYLITALQTQHWSGIYIVGYTADEENSIPSLRLLGSIKATAGIVKEYGIDEVIFITREQSTIVQVSLDLVQEPVMLHMVPSILDLSFARTPVETLGGVPLISLRESALTDGQRVLKRCFDIIGSMLLLVLFSPLMLIIALAIKLESPGTVFFMQERIGEHGRRFRMIKFRSMYQDAERRWAEVARRDEQGNLLHKAAGDPRVTSLGRKLRGSSLDELPQLFNVLRGEMSLVGPRPEMPYIALEEYSPWQWQRFRVPPGITGWWQVNGRAERLMHLHTEDDLYYIQHYSFWLDMKILWMTINAVLRGQGAY